LLPRIDSEVLRTKNGTPYLKAPGVVAISQPATDLSGLATFLEDLGYDKYLEDPMPSPGTSLCKFAGQLCYMSFGDKRTKNSEAQKYIGNILESKHGSVLEHANYTLLLYGVSRSLTHELVRHRAGFAYSQVSQRYVGEDSLRFVERPEYQNNPELHKAFEQRIDQIRSEYIRLTNNLVQLQREKTPELSIEEEQKQSEKIKKCRQVARSILPNETEAPIVVTANVRAWRHFLEMRGSLHAESEMRILAKRVWQVLKEMDPTLFHDISARQLTDGTEALKVLHSKV